MNRALLAVGIAALDVCWIYPWSLLVALWIGAPSLLSPLTMLALVLLAAASTHLALRMLGRERAQPVMIGLALVAALVATRVEHYPMAGALEWLPLLAAALATLIGQPTAPVVALLAGLVLWRRGAQIANSPPTLPDVEGAFRWSVGALIGFAIVLALGVRPTLQPTIEARATPFVVGSFFIALLTLALARLESLRTRTQALGLNTQWLSVLIAVAGLLVLLSLAVAQLLSFDLLLIATRPLFDALGRVLLVVLLVIVVPLAYLIQLLVYWLLQFLSPNPSREPPQPPQDSDMEGFLQRLLTVVPPEALAALKAIGALLVLVVAVLLVARTVARWRPRLFEGDPVDEERDSVYEPGSLWRMVLAWLRWVLRRPSAALPQPPATDSASASATAPMISTVRELYRRLLAAGEAAGTRRPLASTPYEHEPSLVTALHVQEPVADITEAYVQVRYAETEPRPGEVQELTRMLDEVLEPGEP